MNDITIQSYVVGAREAWPSARQLYGGGGADSLFSSQGTHHLHNVFIITIALQKKQFCPNLGHR